jgi:hypothetical protein
MAELTNSFIPNEQEVKKEIKKESKKEKKKESKKSKEKIDKIKRVMVIVNSFRPTTNIYYLNY